MVIQVQTVHHLIEVAQFCHKADANYFLLPQIHRQDLAAFPVLRHLIHYDTAELSGRWCMLYHLVNISGLWFF
ncbi:MAG: hypothetical protein LW696_07840 [Alphaproteobacteria bacterium]|nr:hypothetical protein [Alphaproteobacteria bacterium]